MKKILTILALVFPILLSTSVMAENAQQNKMTACNKEATGKKGDERKAFMKTCLSNKPATAPTQQEKMKLCNASAKDKKGDERKAFMKACLKKQA